MDNQLICTKLYNEGLISYDKYLECSGNSINVRTANMSDEHKYAFSSDSLAQVNIYDKEINIYSDNFAEQKYLAVINTNNANNNADNNANNADNNANNADNNANNADNNELNNELNNKLNNKLNNNKLVLTTGIINKEDAVFIIEKTGDTTISIKNKRTSKYISYNIPERTVGLSNERTNTTNFVMQTFMNSIGIAQYKFLLLKKDGSQTEFSLIIKDNKLAIESNSDFNWNVLAQEYVDVSDLDLLLAEINEIQIAYTKSLQHYNYLVNKKTAVEYIIENINTNINDIFTLFKTLQQEAKILITETQLDISQSDTQTILNDNQLYQLEKLLEDITAELEVAKTDLDLYKIQLQRKIEKIDEYIATRNAEINANKQKIQNYNQTLQNNNIVVDVNQFINADDENAKAILKSEINHNAANIFNGKKTKVNALYVTIISILALIIIVQLSVKLFNIKKGV